MLVESWGIEQVSRNNSSDPRIEARSIHQVSRSYRGGRSFLDRSIRYQGAIGFAIWKSLRSLTDSKVLKRYRGGVEPLFKTILSRGEKRRHECNPTCNSTNDPISQLKFWAHGSQKHTHTHNKSNQFYISKTKSRQFSERTLTHVNLVMVKSYCTCTWIKSSKEFWLLCVKNITRLQMC